MDGCIYRVGIDVGGTFTDIMVMRDGAAGEPAFHDKTPSIPGNEAAAVIDALELAATHHGLALEAFLGATDTIGTASRMSGVNQVDVSLSCGRTFDSAGINNTSSNVRPIRPKRALKAASPPRSSVGSSAIRQHNSGNGTHKEPGEV